MNRDAARPARDVTDDVVPRDRIATLGAKRPSSRHGRPTCKVASPTLNMRLTVETSRAGASSACPRFFPREARPARSKGFAARKISRIPIGEQVFELRASVFGSTRSKSASGIFFKLRPACRASLLEQAAADFRRLASLDEVDVMADLAPRA